MDGRWCLRRWAWHCYVLSDTVRISSHRRRGVLCLNNRKKLLWKRLIFIPVKSLFFSMERVSPEETGYPEFFVSKRNRPHRHILNTGTQWEEPMWLHWPARSIRNLRGDTRHASTTSHKSSSDFTKYPHIARWSRQYCDNSSSTHDSYLFFKTTTMTSTLQIAPRQKLFGSTGSSFDSTCVDKILVRLHCQLDKQQRTGFYSSNIINICHLFCAIVRFQHSHLFCRHALGVMMIYQWRR